LHHLGKAILESPYLFLESFFLLFSLTLATVYLLVLQIAASFQVEAPFPTCCLLSGVFLASHQIPSQSPSY